MYHVSCGVDETQRRLVGARQGVGNLWFGWHSGWVGSIKVVNQGYGLLGSQLKELEITYTHTIPKTYDSFGMYSNRAISLWSIISL